MSNRRVTSALRQRGGRLVHDQDARVVRQRAQDLDPLAVCRPTARRRSGRRRGRRSRARRAAPRPSSRIARQSIRPPSARGAWPRKMFSATDKLGKEQQLLIDRRDAGALGVLGRAEARRAAVDQDLAAVGLIDAGHDLDQRRLAGAVLAEQRMDLARRGRRTKRRSARARRETTSRCCAPRAAGRATSASGVMLPPSIGRPARRRSCDARVARAWRARRRRGRIGDERVDARQAGRRRGCRAARTSRSRRARSSLSARLSSLVSARAISGSPSITPSGPIEIALMNMRRAE